MNIDPEHHHAPHKTGHNWVDLTIAVTALMISITSLIVAFEHSRTLERMADANARLVEANSWPSLSYNTSNGQTISMSIVNDGVGPAKIEAIEVKWAGRAYRDADEFLKACCGFTPGSGGVEYELIAGRVVRAGESVNILGLHNSETDEKARNVLNSARLDRRLTVNVCYCSIFDQCWVEDVVRFSLNPRRVDQCKIPAVPYGIPHI